MITITTYQELTDFVTAFARGDLNTLVICSRGGLGKSEEVRQLLGSGDVVFVGGHVTPLKLYGLLHDGRDKPVVFDEIDGLLADHKHVGLLKQLCETRQPKRIMWASADERAAAIDCGAGHFFTRSHALLLCNSFQAFDANTAALKTRATHVWFHPSPEEILTKIKSFADDDGIVAFLQAFHEAIPDLSLRTYRLLEDLKKAGLDWQRYALNESVVPQKVREIAELLVRFENDLQRLEHYSASRRDYYNWKPQAIAYLKRREAAESPPVDREPIVELQHAESATSMAPGGLSGRPETEGASADGVHSCTRTSGTTRS